MKLFCAISIIFFSVTSLFAQEFIRHSTVHFKDSSTVKGDFYYYPTLTQSITVIDSLGNKQVFVLATIDYIDGKSDLYRIIDFNGTPKIFEAITEGEKVSLYKTDYLEDIQFYVLKEGKMTWLEGGEINFEREGKSYRKENERYKGTLKFLLSDNSYILNKIDEIRYFETSITPIIIAYNDGHISYVKTKAIEKQNRKSDWKIYAHYSNQLNFINLEDLGDHGVKSIQFGGQYFISEGSRHSFKFGFEYNQYELDNGSDALWWDFSTSYRYDTYRMPNCNVYLGVRLFDIYWENGFYDKQFHIFPRLVPLIGYEQHISRKLDLYAEIHHLFNITNIPYNFAVGLSYDF